MKARIKKILLVEDNPADVRYIKEMLKENDTKYIEMTCVSSLEMAIEYLSRYLYDIVLLDLGLPDSTGLITLNKIQNFKSGVPIVVMTGLDNEEIGLEAVKNGAQDFLVKDHVNGYILSRTLYYAIERKKTEEEIKKSHEQLRKLSQHLQKVREEEKFRITVGLYEDMIQIFTALKIDLSLLQKKLSNEQEDEKQRITSMFKLIDNTIKELRNVSHEIRPSQLDFLGLIPAIKWYTEEFQKRTGITCKTSFGLKDIVLSKNLSVTLFRIMQDALDNVEKHAQAKKVIVSINLHHENLKMIISDDGVGIAEEIIDDSKSLGLLSIRERVNQFDGITLISGKTGKGTKVEINIPVKGNEKAVNNQDKNNMIN